MDELNHFIVPPISPQDIDQEVELLKLEGVENPKRSLIYKRMMHSELSFDEIPDFISVQPILDTTPEVDFQVTERLIEWALDQEDEIQTLIFNFLDEPTERSLKKTMKKLSQRGVELHEVTSHRGVSLTDIIRHEIISAPCTIDYLYQVARNLHPSRRPEAAVRTILRKLISLEEVVIDGTRYHYTG